MSLVILRHFRFVLLLTYILLLYDLFQVWHGSWQKISQFYEIWHQKAASSSDSNKKRKKPLGVQQSMLILLVKCQNSYCLHLVQNNNTCLSTDSYFLQKLYNWTYCRMSEGFYFHCRSCTVRNAVLHYDDTNLFFLYFQNCTSQRAVKRERFSLHQKSLTPHLWRTRLAFVLTLFSLVY